MEKTYTYYVSYSFITKTGKPGLGSCSITRKNPIKGMDDTAGIASSIKKNDEMIDSVVILNWIQLSRKIYLFK